MSTFGNCPVGCPFAKEYFDLACADREYSDLQQFTPGLERFFNKGIRTGHFLEAVLKNDLQDAFARADPDAVTAMPRLLQLLYNHAPALAWGSPEKVEAWRKRVRQDRGVVSA